MAMPGESDHAFVCTNCGSNLIHGVQRSAAGYYIGTLCPCCGPYARESRYFATMDEAEHHLFDASADRETSRMCGWCSNPARPGEDYCSRRCEWERRKSVYPCL